MLSLSSVNRQIISTSVQNSKKTAEDNKKVKSDVLNDKPKSDKKNALAMTGAVALAGIAIAGIIISRNRNAKNVVDKTEEVLSDIDDVVIEAVPSEVTSFSEEIFNKAKNAEKKVRAQISKKFLEFRDNGIDSLGFAQRIKTVTDGRQSVKSVDKTLLDKEEFDAAFNFIDDSLLNAKLKAGLDLSEDVIVKKMDNLIENSTPLENESYVYSGIRTQKIWDDFLPEEIISEIKEGNTIKDKGFVLTSRVYDDILAKVDPMNYKDHESCGYLLRILLPKGTKGFDGRRFTGRNSDRGYNARFILARNSELKINSIDDNTRIIDCEYILPSNSN